METGIVSDSCGLFQNLIKYNGKRVLVLQKVIEEKMTYLNFWNISIVSFIDLLFALILKHPHWEAATRGVLSKKLFLEISKNPQENTCARVSLKACNFTKKETLAQVFFCAFCEISKNTFLQNIPGRQFLHIDAIITEIIHILPETS